MTIPSAHRQYRDRGRRARRDPTAPAARPPLRRRRRRARRPKSGREHAAIAPSPRQMRARPDTGAAEGAAHTADGGQHGRDRHRGGAARCSREDQSSACPGDDARQTAASAALTHRSAAIFAARRSRSRRARAQPQWRRRAENRHLSRRPEHPSAHRAAARGPRHDRDGAQRLQRIRGTQCVQHFRRFAAVVVTRTRASQTIQKRLVAHHRSGCSAAWRCGTGRRPASHGRPPLRRPRRRRTGNRGARRCG